MRFTSAAAAMAFATTVHAHTRMYSVWVNGEDQGDGRSVYIRSPPTNDPVKDLTSADLVCNTAGGTAVDSFVSAAAGDTLSFEWYHDTRGDDIIDLSHLGPIITYIAPYTTDDGASPIWSKIDEEGYSDGTWAVENLVSNSGKKDFTLPSNVAAGQYLIRQEIIALHEADVAYTENSARGAQFYPSCVQVEVTGSGSDVPDTDFDFNTGYTETDPGIVFNLYASYTSYDIPGPAIWTASGSSSGSSSAVAATTTAAAATTSTSAAAATTTTAAAATTVTSAVSSVVSQAPTTLQTSTRAATSVSTAAPAQTSSVDSCDDTGDDSDDDDSDDDSSETAALYYQCGGANWTGATTCSEGTCTVMNPYYSQCVN
ncbi:glycosyl hydrolase family 61-domain-containing protein [Xylariaceae sp. FL1272]|nr:glycosyl hydrolase family 61-domain-containing protein [Xylariaceae sp. FL1272]